MPYIGEEKCNIFLESESVLNIQYNSISLLKLHTLKTYLGNSKLTVNENLYYISSKSENYEIQGYLGNSKLTVNDNLYYISSKSVNYEIQGYLQRMRLQRRLYVISYKSLKTTVHNLLSLFCSNWWFLLYSNILLSLLTHLVYL